VSVALGTNNRLAFSPLLASLKTVLPSSSSSCSPFVFSTDAQNHGEVMPAMSLTNHTRLALSVHTTFVPTAEREHQQGEESQSCCASTRSRLLCTNPDTAGPPAEVSFGAEVSALNRPGNSRSPFAIFNPFPGEHSLSSVLLLADLITRRPGSREPPNVLCDVEATWRRLQRPEDC
jgi:hypothetical protein